MAAGEFERNEARVMKVALENALLTAPAPFWRDDPVGLLRYLNAVAARAANDRGRPEPDIPA
jgi:hypothetical protein